MINLILVLGLTTLTFIAVAQPELNIHAQAESAVSNVTSTTSKTGTNIWTERILNNDGTIDWKEYENVASHAGELSERDYLLGPKYVYFHPQAESFPTLALQGDADGWEGPTNYQKYLKTGVGGPGELDWYAQAGSLLYVADSPHNGGVMSAGNGENYIYDAGITPPYGFWYKVNWQSRRCCYLYPDPPELQQPDWNSPKKPVAVATPTGTQAIAQYAVSYTHLRAHETRHDL